LPTRRQFIKVGIAGAAVLATVRWLDKPQAAPAVNHRFLDAPGVVMVAAFVPVVLEGSLPEEAEPRAAPSARWSRPSTARCRASRPRCSARSTSS
jgi:hypothetical protein